MALSPWFLLVGLLAAAGCEKRPPRDDRQPATGESAGGAGGHMGGMQMDMQSMRMMPMMRAHMDSMARMAPEQMQAAMATHQTMMSQMMDAMGADMRGMGTQADPAWVALTDSVRRDLAEFPTLSGEKLRMRVQAHAARVSRLMTVHENMMK